MRICLLTLLIIAGVILSTQGCNIPILRDIISINSGKTAAFEDGLGTSSTDRLVPLLNQSEALKIRHLGNFETFSTPIFTLDTSYWITAIDIQFGSVGSCTENGQIRTMETIRVGDGDPATVVIPFIEIGYATNDIMNLTELGDPNNGRIIRLKTNPIRGSFIKFRVS